VHYVFTFLLLAFRFAAAVSLIVFAFYWRSPIFAANRPQAMLAFAGLVGVLLAFELWRLRRIRNSRSAAVVPVAILAIAGGALALTLFQEAQFHWMRYGVLHADRAALERLGRHIVIGYRDIDELRALIERRAIAGVFVSAHNVRGKDTDAIRAEIASLQAVRKRQGLPPLLIATDQEGGIVSRLSPPLPRQTSLGDVVRKFTRETERLAAVREFASKQGRALADLGINLNFAPVVDLNYNIVNPDDLYTRIYRRAISDDPKVVTAIAGEYCAALVRTGVHCTLKHFPGLGGVTKDTHLEDADLTTPVATLIDTDWVPFRGLMHHAGVFTMLGHARLTAIDKDTPASFSKAVVSGLLRQSWKHDGLLITDDFSMSAAYGSKGGLAAAGVSALNAGVDLILISYDPDLFYPMMHALLRAQAAGALRGEELDRSDRRLNRAWSGIAN
jgi:beta-N-acetylhexosaminidase